MFEGTSGSIVAIALLRKVFAVDVLVGEGGAEFRAAVGVLARICEFAFARETPVFTKLGFVFFHYIYGKE